ncbi:hypothetical protein [Azohydromonas lata]|uniref:Uncharacterized protein n=1 Tax=Azohydromonas lata TaxID=45677 RepID=A0ABU5IHM8_9BURK|nr:hypothetical protein [Azohydromonas lata]MDZ5458654.1 hypothetical protein [Azohydromonas lata]
MGVVIKRRGRHPEGAIPFHGTADGDGLVQAWKNQFLGICRKETGWRLGLVLRGGELGKEFRDLFRAHLSIRSFLSDLLHLVKPGAKNDLTALARRAIEQMMVALSCLGHNGILLPSGSINITTLLTKLESGECNAS